MAENDKSVSTNAPDRRNAVLDSFDLETAQAIHKKFQDWQNLRDEFAVSNVYDSTHRPSFPVEYLKLMAEMIDISRPASALSHRPVVGPLIVWLKKMLPALASPFVRLILRRQIIMNEIVFDLANSCVLLEQRVRALESQLKKTNPHSSSAHETTAN